MIFTTFPLDDTHLVSAARYVELNPVRARLAARPEDRPWSSARADLSLAPEKKTAADLILTSDLPDMIGDWRRFLDSGIAPELTDLIRRHERTGRPLGSDGFLKELEQQLGRRLRKRKPGPKADTTEPS